MYKADNQVKHQITPTGGLFEGGLFDEPPMPDVPAVDASIPDPSSQELPAMQHESDDDDDHMDFGGPPSVASSDGSRPPSSMAVPIPTAPTPTPSVHSIHPEPLPEPIPEEPVPSVADQTTLLRNEEESFALAPVDATLLKGMLPSGMMPHTPGMMPPTPGMVHPATPGGMMYPQTPGYPGPPTPLHHIEDMPHLPADQASQKFYSLLVLKKFHVLELEQDEPYGTVTVFKGPKFDNPSL
ncbi:hypothetical protein JTB14_035899 [Gonioctena quinquepunctata]|nr:hypothetical protein JTB14_035899 [Gonioctena quinquepunctata]